MRSLAAFFAVFQLLLFGTPALAQDIAGTYGSVRTVSTESWVEEWDPRSGQWVRVSDSDAAMQADLPTVTTTIVNGQVVSETRAATRYAQPIQSRPNGAMLAQYGPFVVMSETRVAMVGATDSSSPAMFDAMMRDFPGLEVLEMIEAPGTSNDIANLAVARRIRANGISTYVPSGGSVRSGAVELFLAGQTRTVEDGAMFAVHSWLDNHGREAEDFAPDHPAHRLYLDFYVEMGMSEPQARAFYSMTNSVPHSSALWLTAADMRPWLRSDATPAYRMAAAPGTEAPAMSSPSAFPAAQPALPAPSIVWGELAIQPIGSAFPPVLDYDDMSAITLAQLDSRHSFP